MTISREGMDAMMRHYAETTARDGAVVRVTWDHEYGYATSTFDGGMEVPNADARVVLGAREWEALLDRACTAHGEHVEESRAGGVE